MDHNIVAFVKTLNLWNFNQPLDFIAINIGPDSIKRNNIIIVNILLFI
jgi:hypothetical protein